MTSPAKILVVDDDPTARLLMRAALQKAGFQVQVAVGGADALRQFSRDPFDMVMLDVDMPDISGMKVCRELRTQGGEHLPIVMVTGMDDVDSVHAAYQCGATDFIAKPINWAMMGHRANHLLRAARTQSELIQAHSRSQLAASVFTHAREGILITDAHGSIMEVNDTFTHITGYARAEVIGKNPRLLKSERHAAAFYTDMWEALLRDGHWAGEIWNRRKNGDTYADMRTISAVRDAAGKIVNYVALFSDITAMKVQQRQLELIAHYDSLTGLPNRVLLADRLQQAMAQALRRKHCMALVFLDLDGFKEVNDQHGHAMGDQLLQSVSQRLKLALRDGDTLARIGGDEFVAVLVDLEHAHDFEPVVQRMLHAAAEPICVDDTVMRVTASMGVTIYPQDSAQADVLIRHADQAMYASKQAGKNRYRLFDVAQDAAVQIQQAGVQHMRTAMEHNELLLYYQPKVNMRSGQVIGAEALIRWQHPERGLLGPAAFLPFIEDHAISFEVGEWVIFTALQQISTWRKQGLDLPVSVNIDARHLQQDDFVTRLGQLMQAHPDVAPHCLQLEVLETSALMNMTKVSQVMHHCQALGVSFALDDFGTGYSSLTYLKHLPAATLKIDQSFVRNMPNDPNDLAIASGVIALAKSFGRQVIAEGVETAQHGQLLQSIGCDQLQGYGIARPMPCTEMPQWVANWHSAANWTA
jgi:diguanylate cyclase (GGDEF)-like protein/PAS domain S-box-containing protein